MGNTGNYSLYDYLDYLDVLGDEKGTKDILLDLLFVPLIIACFVNISVGLAGLAGLISYNIVSYFGKKKIIDPYITSFVMCAGWSTPAKRSVNWIYRYAGRNGRRSKRAAKL